MIITNEPNIFSLTKMQAKLNQFAKEIWGRNEFCKLLTSVPCERIGTTMIEQFKLS